MTVVDIDEKPVIDAYEKKLVLVRPDGHVAWRGDGEPEAPLTMIDTVRGAGPRIAARRADEPAAGLNVTS